MTKDMRERALAELNFNREEGALEADKQKRIERVRMYCHAFQKIEEELDKRVKGIAG